MKIFLIYHASVAKKGGRRLLPAAKKRGRGSAAPPFDRMQTPKKRGEELKLCARL